MNGAVKVRRNSKGAYYARPYLGRDVSGRPIRPYRLFPEAGSEAEAQRMAEEWARGLTASAGLHIGSTVAEVAERYLRSLKARKASPSTVRTYESLIRCYVAPMFGRMAPQDVQPYMVEDFYTEALIDGACGRDRISPNTVRKIHGFLKGMFHWMHRQGALEVDAMASVDAPPRETAEARALDEGQIAKVDEAAWKIVAAASSAPFRRAAAMATLASLWCGLRVGEDCGLSRADASLERATLHVRSNAVETASGVERRNKTKGKKSRTVRMPERLAGALEAQFEWQETFYGADSRSGAFPICSSESGGLVRPSSVSRWFRGLCGELGLPRDVHFHTLRHTHASVLLAEGMDLKTLAERLGHAKESLTLEIYSHVMPGRDDRAAGLLDDVAERIGGAR